MDDRTALTVRLRQASPIPLDVDFTARSGEITALFGPSGSGKTTVLRAIAGLYRPLEAEIRCGGTSWTDTAQRHFVPPHRRSVGMVFQDYALFPHVNVREQLALAMDHVEPDRRRERIDALLDLVQLTGLDERRPAALSGGQQQRVALARALARDPQVLLLDEPFSSVDWAAREALRRELVRLHRALRLAIVLVTHDFDDVAKLAHRLVVLERGAVAASGSIEDVTARNAVAGLAAREPGVSLDVEVIEHDRERELSLIGVDALRLWVPPIAAEPGSVIRVQISASDVILATRRQSGLSLHNVLEARILEIREAAEAGLRLVHVAVGRTHVLSMVTADAVRSLGLEPGADVLTLIKAVAVERFA